MIGEILNIGGKIIDRLWPDATEKEKAKLKLMEMQQRGELAELENRFAAIVAEAKSNDKWTSRARPAFLYVMYGVIGLCFLGGILGIWFPEQIGLAATNIQTLLASIPDALWTLFGAGYLGYSGVRSFDKHILAKGNKNGSR